MTKEKKNIVWVAAVSVLLSAVFLGAEYIGVKVGLFGSGMQKILVDSAFRLVFGCIAMGLLVHFSEGSVKELFTNRIPRVIWLLMIPIYVFFLSYLLGFGMVEEVSLKGLPIFAAVVLDQIMTGWWEESANRGLIMEPFRKHYGERKMRVIAVVLSGVIFGLTHIFNAAFFGGSILDSCYTAFCTGMWGMFIAAIYMVSDNLLLVMAIHAIWDILVRIPGNFFITGSEPTSLAVAGEVLRTVIDPFLLGVLAIVIALKFGEKTEKTVPEVR